MITFYEQATGFSHIASGKPCQDNGLSYKNNEVCIAIVCDGHGGESYVRSNKGSLIAAEVAKDRILDFIHNQKFDLLLNKKGAVTAKPLSNPLKGKNGERINFSSLSESQQELALQNKSYIDESEKHQEVENVFRELFAVIVEDWRSRIDDDSKNNPFDKSEKEKLGFMRIEKAYGTTLMAAVRTRNYWFAFHIGDGKLLAFNNNMEWKEPVPWDCNCFLNTTTSLCDSDPIEEFRYAFDGTGEFPLAFVLGSDGIDNALNSQDSLYKFYSKMLCVFEQYKQEAIKHLKAHLSVLSEKGNHDDMSVAAIIDTEHLETVAQYFSIISKKDKLNRERKEKEKELNDLREEIENAEVEIETLKNECHKFCHDSWEYFINALKKYEKDKSEAEAKIKYINNKKCQRKQLEERLEKLETEFEDWKTKGKERISQFKEEVNKLKSQIVPDLGKNSIKESDEQYNDNF